MNSVGPRNRRVVSTAGLRRRACNTKERRQEEISKSFVTRVRRLGFIPSVKRSHWRVSSKDLVYLLKSYMEMLNIISHQGNANQNYNEIPLHVY